MKPTYTGTVSKAVNLRIIALHAQDWNQGRIAGNLGIHRTSVSRRAKKLGLKFRYNRIKDRKGLSLIELRRRHAS